MMLNDSIAAVILEMVSQPAFFHKFGIEYTNITENVHALSSVTWEIINFITCLLISISFI